MMALRGARLHPGLHELEVWRLDFKYFHSSVRKAMRFTLGRFTTRYFWEAGGVWGGGGYLKL